MESTQTIQGWLGWLSRVRILIITFILVIVLALRGATLLSAPTKYFVPLIVLWYTVAFFFVILLRWIPQVRWHASLQLVCDVVMITGLVYVTGGHESYFISLYLLAIIVASILFSTRGTFLVAGLSFVLLGALVELSFYHKILRTAVAMPSEKALQTWILSNLFGFLAVAYLSSLLAQTLRRKGVELEEKSEELQDLQAFNEDIIHSMRGGLLTTDLDGRILLLNRTGEEITGHRFQAVRGRFLADAFPDFWLAAKALDSEGLVPRSELEFRTAEGQLCYLGISVSPLRTGEGRTSGYVFNFQDLTELRRLEQEVATKDRMAALGRLSAAIAHEIRQPLTAMTGSIKELARMMPLQEDEKHLVGI